ncbi:MAG: hypothetical protein ACRENZ_02845 [Thermodesulfobacteriota bacterium]
MAFLSVWIWIRCVFPFVCDRNSIIERKTVGGGRFPIKTFGSKEHLNKRDQTPLLTGGDRAKRFLFTDLKDQPSLCLK